MWCEKETDARIALVLSQALMYRVRLDWEIGETDTKLL
jgi:hypothetical protein